MSRPAVVAHDGRGPVAPATPERHLPGWSLNDSLVRERDRERARELLRVLTLGIAVLVPLLLHVWQQVVFVETAYRIEDLRGQRVEMEQRLRAVRLERAALQSLDRVEEQARSMGLIEPAAESVILVFPAGRPAPGAAPR